MAAGLTEQEENGEEWKYDLSKFQLLVISEKTRNLVSLTLKSVLYEVKLWPFQKWRPS